MKIVPDQSISPGKTVEVGQFLKYEVFSDGQVFAVPCDPGDPHAIGTVIGYSKERPDLVEYRPLPEIVRRMFSIFC